ncbi:hypothetical protein [Kineosporia sp. R_H_3]|uniref:hypothetical protein n=1 Tax=Kineosporia sp. R_H_3 TaxID=1961848 RepID=UPI000B4BE17A|nr:hypothetical protein [Kineosporia sp. R_H_3]
MTDHPTVDPAVQAAGTAVEVSVEVSVADWTAGYEAGYAAGYLAARSALDAAARALAVLRPSRAVDVAGARTGTPAADEPDRNDPAAVAAYRARIYASWGLPPPTDPTAVEQCSEPDAKDRRTAGATP